MDTEKQRSFLIHFLYYAILLALLYVFLRYLIYLLMPFLIGFIIAFLLRPIIRKCAVFGHEKLWSLLIIFLFYGCLGMLLTYLLMKGFFYMQEGMALLPDFYYQYIEPQLQTSMVSAHSAWESIDVNTADIFQKIVQGMEHSLSTFISNLSHSLLQLFTSLMSSIPKILLSFFFAILSSFFINADYPKITKRLTHHLSSQNLEKLRVSLTFIRTTLWNLSIAYTKLMLITFIELWIGLQLLGVDYACSIAIAIALFDIVPILGSGGIMLPWALICYLNSQQKLAIGLVVLYLCITLIRNVLEPHIVAHQIGLHPLLMLITMYIGAKVFGLLGALLLPFVLLIILNIRKEGY